MLIMQRVAFLSDVHFNQVGFTNRRQPTPAAISQFRDKSLRPEHQARQAVELAENELELVFPNEAGKPIDGMNLYHRIFVPTLKRAGLRHVRFHDLRHSYAAALISAGENPKWIQRQLGHSSIQVTMDICGHLFAGY